MHINHDVLKKISGQVAGLLHDHIDEMEEAFLKSDSDKLGISMASTVEVTKDPGSMKVKTTLSFVKEKVKDEAVDYVELNQISFLDEERDE